MKYNKTIWLIASLLTVFITGCDGEEKIILNNISTTVEFGNTEFTQKETTDFVLMPIVVKSDYKRDGDIFVQVTMKENNAGFELGKEVVLTTQTLRITADQESINFEAALYVDNEEITKGRNVTFEITNAQGASLGTSTTCKINILERIFAEGTYAIRGINPFDDMMSTGACRLFSTDESIENMKIDFGVGRSGDIIFTEIVKDMEYDIEIPAFQSIGSHEGYNVILTWASYIRSTQQLLYDKEKPIKGKFVRTIENGRETVVINFEDGFGLLGDRDGEYNWFYNVYVEGPTMTKQ